MSEANETTGELQGAGTLLFEFISKTEWEG